MGSKLDRRGPLILTQLTIALACVALVIWQKPILAAAVEVQHKACGFTAAMSTTVNCSFDTNVTGTNRVVAGMSMWVGNGGVTSFAVSDATNGTYTDDVNNIISGNVGAQISSKPNLTGGFTQVTIACVGGACNAGWYTDLWEVSGTDNALMVLTGTRAEGLGTSHQCADTGVSGTGFIVCVGPFYDNVFASADAGAKTGITSWTNHSFDGFTFAQRRISTFSTEVGAFTTANSVRFYAALALYRQTATTGVPSGLSLLGVGR